MKLFYIGIIKNESKPAVELAVEKDLSSYSRFTRNNSLSSPLQNPHLLLHPTIPSSTNLPPLPPYSYAEFMTLFSKTVAERTRPGQRQDIEEQDYTFHAYARSEGICGLIISDKDYPALVAHQLLSKIVDEFLSQHPQASFAAPSTQANSLSFPALKEYLAKYQDPGQADSIMKIQRELDETKIVLHKTIESVLERGESINMLVEKSNDLSSQSRMFYTQVCV
ncbi:MAG: hypothetical protein LQ340_000164 [Diploschistes diacapsis]|nr:MAG: hypothetical protein LQ340_000164 [Diploschistes diacapsis]